MNYRKKPVVIQAVEWTGKNIGDIIKFMGSDAQNWTYDDDFLYIHTLEGTMIAQKGSFVVKGIRGEFYAVEPSIFADTYEKAD